MYQFFKGLRANYLLSAILCVIFGITLIVWPDISIRIVCIGLGCVLALSGLVNLITYFVARDGSFLSHINLLVGIILAVMGVWIILKPDILIMMVPIVIGVIVVVHGVHNLVQTVELCRNRYSKWWVALLLGIATIGFGVLLVVNPFEAVSTVIILIGIFLIYDGISDIWIISRVSKTAKAIKQTMDALDVEAEIISDKEE